MRPILFLLIVAALTACEKKAIIHEHDADLVRIQHRTNDATLLSISIMDRNGLSETVSAKERVKNYENTNFLTAQPYQKVLRVFAKDKHGDALSIITSYYPTGQIRQLLECSNGRASGRYIEWHTNGQKKLQATILGGHADLDEKSQTTWSFNDTSYCWDEEGKLIATIPYAHGLLEGTSNYYYPSGVLSEAYPYHKGEIDGDAISFDENGNILESTHYSQGVKTGKSVGFWAENKPQFEEDWQDDMLQKGSYYNQEGQLLSEITNGTGVRTIFGDIGPSETQNYIHGRPEGEVVLFDEKGTVTRRLSVKDGEKHGLETYYWTFNPSQPKLTIEWVRGQMHGTVKTWYENGSPESSREMSHNLKQGHLTAWYSDGKIMLIEEYEKDRLVRGDYLKPGSNKPVSQVINGKGVATFYESDGTFRTRITYHDGKPVLDDLLSER
ncbi:MAG: toxin-antitoxin system YwqK family antitoxin [Verrucomicrobia bacterium]|nr:toxin-antitoxin system YwqK family antitoxin [Verrucomicrobiota bacterium]MBS0637564.1 toxin-antitoxin system YwqK family antitoxin [Verrucomicrobiota bacterium]